MGGQLGLFLFLLEVVGVVAQVGHQLPVADFHDLVGHTGDEVAVVGDHQHAALVGNQGVLQHLFGWNVEVVGGLIEHQQIAGFQQHQGQGQPCFFASRELAGFLKHRLIAETEAAQQRAHLGLGPVGDHLKDGVDHRFAEVEGFGLVLLEIARHHVVFAEAGVATPLGFFHAHHQPQQGGFAGAIGADKGDPIPPFHLQVGP